MHVEGGSAVVFLFNSENSKMTVVAMLHTGSPAGMFESGMMAPQPVGMLVQAYCDLQDSIIDCTRLTCLQPWYKH